MNNANTRNIIINGSLEVPSDKSIAHRAFILAALANGISYINATNLGADVQRTIYCLRCLGVTIRLTNSIYSVEGVGLHGFIPYHGYLDTGNSGTTARMLIGVLSGQSFCSKLTGDASLQKRPMDRVVHPLAALGSSITYLNHTLTLPLLIKNSTLTGASIKVTVPSAQVKSALLFAALNATSTTTIQQEINTRDHTERLFKSCGLPIEIDNKTIILSPPSYIKPFNLSIPGDPSSAAYFITAALLVPNSHLILTNVSINPTRTGFIRVLHKMGADITIHPIDASYEPSANIEISSSILTGITLTPQETADLIDELPLLALIGCYASGITYVPNALELRYKESDRLDSILSNFSNMGANIHLVENGFRIIGGRPLHNAPIITHSDHRMAMTGAIASLLMNKPCFIDNPSSVTISYPNFFKDLASIITQ